MRLLKMKNIIKKSLISLITISSCVGSTTLLSNAKEIDNEIIPQTINIENNKINFETYDDNHVHMT